METMKPWPAPIQGSVSSKGHQFNKRIRLHPQLGCLIQGHSARTRGICDFLEWKHGWRMCHLLHRKWNDKKIVSFQVGILKTLCVCVRRLKFTHWHWFLFHGCIGVSLPTCWVFRCYSACYLFNTVRPFTQAAVAVHQGGSEPWSHMMKVFSLRFGIRWYVDFGVVRG